MDEIDEWDCGVQVTLYQHHAFRLRSDAEELRSLYHYEHDMLTRGRIQFRPSNWVADGTDHASRRGQASQ